MNVVEEIMFGFQRHQAMFLKFLSQRGLQSVDLFLQRTVIKPPNPRSKENQKPVTTVGPGGDGRDVSAVEQA